MPKTPTNRHPFTIAICGSTHTHTSRFSLGKSPLAMASAPSHGRGSFIFIFISWHRRCDVTRYIGTICDLRRRPAASAWSGRSARVSFSFFHVAIVTCYYFFCYSPCRLLLLLIGRARPPTPHQHTAPLFLLLPPLRLRLRYRRCRRRRLPPKQRVQHPPSPLYLYRINRSV